MKFKKRIAVSFMALVITFSFTSCLLLEEALLVPNETSSQAYKTIEADNPPPLGPEVNWLLTAQGLDGSIGERFTLKLPPKGVAASVWGTGIYTDDSSIGTAAVHMGLINFDQGGKVLIEIRDGLDSYETSSMNGVVSAAYGAWDASYVFIDNRGDVVEAKQPKSSSAEILDANWSTNAFEWDKTVGRRYSMVLPSAGRAGSVWGTTIYTNDSSIGTAAVHAGLISFASGGKVTIEIVEGQSSYEGSSRNGVDSGSYGPWAGSFIFVR